MTSNGFDLGAFLQDFVSECRESADLAVEDILNLEQGRDQGTVDRIFRSLHSIKGNASMFGLMSLSEFVHKVEDTCSDIRSGEREIDKPVINLLLKSFDLIEDAFEHILAKGSDNIDYSAGYKLLEDILPDGASPATVDMESAEAEPTADETLPQPEEICEVVDSEPQPDVDHVPDEVSFASDAEEETASAAEPAVQMVYEPPRLSVSSVRTNPTALIVDDDFATRKIFMTFISKFMPCYIAKDGVEAIQAVTESFNGTSPHFDLIIMDIMMPNIDGLQATQAIRQIERSKNASEFDRESKIFIASTLDDDKTMLKAVYECQADTYLVKPIHFDELRRQLVRYRLIDPV